MAALYVSAEVVLPVILPGISKRLPQPLVRLPERAQYPRLVGAIISVVPVLGVVA